MYLLLNKNNSHYCKRCQLLYKLESIKHNYYGEFLLAFQTIASANLPVTGSFMDIRIDTLMTSGSEAIGFDNIQVMGVPEPNTTAIVFSLASLILLLTKQFLPRRENVSRA